MSLPTSASPSTTHGVPSGTPVHPLYATWAPIWRKLAHVYEGSGGFLDGTYLVAHPREWEDWDKDLPEKPSKKLKARRALARYENIAETILDQKRTAIFRENIVRTVGGKELKEANHPLVDWWGNVNGRQVSIDDWMAEAFIPAAIFGSVVHVMDRRPGPAPVTKADETPPYLRLYSPLDMPDWITDDDGELLAVRLLEGVTRKTLKESHATDLRAVRERLIDGEEWEITREAGHEVTGRQGFHRMGRLPVILHYAKRRGLSGILGQSVLKDPQLYIDLYNLTSEIRELLRSQTFGWLNVELGTGDNATKIQDAKDMLGQTAGTDNVLFSPAAANFIQPDSANVTVYQAERRDLLRTIYRLAAVPWESDSKDAEAEGSLKLKREDMNQVLAGYADECERTEYQLVELFFRATQGEGWERALEQAEVTIRYPDNFDVTPFAEILEQAESAVTLEMPPSFMKELRRRLVAKFIPDASPSVIAEIDKELEEMAKQAKEMGSSGVAKQVKQLLERNGGQIPEMPEERVAA